MTTVGLDLAKNIFHLVACNKHGKVVSRKKLSRTKLRAYFAQLPPCLIGMEACSTSHYWARELIQLGHQAKLIPAQHVKAYLRGNKNDFNDALAIAEAVVRPEMRFVAVKNVEQQDQQTLNVHRQQLIRARTAEANRIRAMLSEQGVVIAKGLAVLRRSLPELMENQEGQFSELFITLLQQAYLHLVQLDEHIARSDRELRAVTAQSPACQQLQGIPGFGPISASLFHSYVGDASGYRRGRDVSAALGLVPKQFGTGGKIVLLGISKRGNRNLRCLLVHGARAVVSRVGDKQDALSLWIKRLIARVGIHKATVAYANKMARIGWAVLRHQCEYQPNHVPKLVQ
ncbi:MAG: IS110 family transposase [Gammaproteobacteria bacterium]|nr:IS110 family transposase [Gammaproteobacteria bacterium]